MIGQAARMGEKMIAGLTILHPGGNEIMIKTLVYWVYNAPHLKIEGSIGVLQSTEAFISPCLIPFDRQ